METSLVKKIVAAQAPDRRTGLLLAALCCLSLVVCAHAGASDNSALSFKDSSVLDLVQVQNFLDWEWPGMSTYVVIGWNDLGMHCISPSFKEMAILPPYNNLMVQVIKPGRNPKVITDGIFVEYSFDNNTTCDGKTDFWDYAQALFGVTLPYGTGLTGLGLTGKLTKTGDHFEARGIPLLPYDDTMNWNPYQVATVKVRNARGMLLKTTRVVLPVSDELHCDKCHADGGDAGPAIATGTVEGNILTLHDIKNSTTLMASRPVLCSSCHADNALGLAGDPLRRSLSQAMHVWHGAIQGDLPGCYDCHPGTKTQCNRSAIPLMGNTGNTPNCQLCHGELGQVGGSIAQGRQPWLQEPSCATCHGDRYSTGDALYKNSRGHGGLFCAACHNSQHAYWPSKNAADNMQPGKLQKFPLAIGKCTVCHKKLTMQGYYNPHWIDSAPK